MYKRQRVYKAEDWAWYFATFIANGIFPKPSDGLQVVAYSGMEDVYKRQTLYCKAEFGFNNNAEQFRKSYDALKMRLALSVEYNTAPERCV